MTSSPAWIAALKPGDRVAVYRSTVPPMVGRVTTRTASARLVVKLATGAEIVFNPDGRERGATYDAWRLKELTPEVEREMEERTEKCTLLCTLDSTRWRDLPLETLRAVAALLPEKEKE